MTIRSKIKKKNIDDDKFSSQTSLVKPNKQDNRHEKKK